MGKTVIVSHNNTMKLIGQDERCATCTCSCKTTCVRQKATETDIKHSNNDKEVEDKAKKTD